MLVVKVPQQNVVSSIQSVTGDYEEIYLNRRPSVKVIRTLLANCPRLKRLYCPPSLYNQTARRAFETLGEAAVVLEPKHFGIGRPFKHPLSIREKVLEMRRGGVPVLKIAKTLKVPLRTAYYFLEKAGEVRPK